MDRIGIDHLSVFGLRPVEFVELAASLGCRHISLAPSPIVAFNPHGYPPFSLTKDRALRADTLAAMRHHGVAISAGSGFLMGADTEVPAYAADLEALAELGVKRINAVSWDTERSRGYDRFAELAEFAAGFGVATMAEIVPVLLVNDLAAGLDLVRHVGRPDFTLLIDTLHIVRAGSSADDLSKLDPALVGYIQLCDGPLVATRPDYGEEVTYHRLAPGDGGLPLAELMAALPKDVLVGLEIPMAEKAEAGIGPYERLKPCVDAARRLLAGVG